MLPDDLVATNFERMHALADEDGQIFLDERAAIYEFDAGNSRERAEDLAAVEYAIWELEEIRSGRAAQKIIANRSVRRTA